ncbi:MAG: hypothetical protein WBX50_11245 [Candidatus Deferrimicrobiaceae bacterium]
MAVTPGIDFGEGAEGFLPFSYADSPENIGNALNRLRIFLLGRDGNLFSPLTLPG